MLFSVMKKPYLHTVYLVCLVPTLKAFSNQFAIITSLISTRLVGKDAHYVIHPNNMDKLSKTFAAYHLFSGSFPIMANKSIQAKSGDLEQINYTDLSQSLHNSALEQPSFALLIYWTVRVQVLISN